MKNKLKLILVIMVSLAMILPACGQAPTPVATEAATEVPTEVATDVPTEAPVAAEPCLIIGATYGGSITDAGYNQAMHEAVTDIKTNIPWVSIIEADNVYDEAGATNTMQSMIDQGAGMIIATGSQHQYPALGLAEA